MLHRADHNFCATDHLKEKLELHYEAPSYNGALDKSSRADTFIRPKENPSAFHG